MEQVSGAEQGKSNLFDEIQKKIVVKEIKDSFCKKGYMVTEIQFLELTESKISVKITTLDNNKILVEKDLTSMKWKLNALPMGEVIGKDVSDVAYSYNAERAKDRR